MAICQNICRFLLIIAIVFSYNVQILAIFPNLFLQFHNYFHKFANTETIFTSERAVYGT